MTTEQATIAAVVAEQIMGWTRRGYYRDPALEKNPFYDIWFNDKASRYESDIRSWSPMTDPAAALHLLGKMREIGFSCEMDIPTVPRKVAVKFSKPNKVATWITGDNFMEAICNSAIHAVGLTERIEP